MAKARQLELNFKAPVQLDFLTPELAPPPPLPKPQASPPAAPKGPVAPPQKAKPKASASQENYAIEPPSLPPNTRWRVLNVDGTNIGFALRRSRRKSIGLTVGEDGLTITAPHWVTLVQVDEAVQAKSPWILRKLAERQQRKEQTATADTAWQHEGTIPYFGVRIRLILGEQSERTSFAGEPFAPREGDRLLLALPAQADHNRVRDAVHAWLQHQAQAWFGPRLQHFLEKADLPLKQWRLSSASTRWGSCSSDGSIRLNWRLIHFSHEVIDYVVAHEVAHLREMNHGPRFWQEVARLMPGFETARNALKTHTPDTLPLL